MELRQYWNVIWKRRWLVLAVIGLVAAISAFLALTAPRTYRGDEVFTARQEPVPFAPGTEPFIYGGYYNWIASEFLVDDYTQILETQAFAMNVIDVMKSEAALGHPTGVKNLDKLKSDINKLKPMDVQDQMGSDRRQRELRVFAITPSRDLTLAELAAAGIVITRGPIKPLRGDVKDKPLFGQMDEANVDDLQSSVGREITNAATRVVLGIVAALALAFLLEYLDRSVRDERDASRILEMPVLGTIPRV